MKTLVIGNRPTSPREAAEWLESHGTADEITHLLPDLVFLWAANHDPDDAERWVLGHEGSSRIETLTKALNRAIRARNRR